MYYVFHLWPLDYQNSFAVLGYENQQPNKISDDIFLSDSGGCFCFREEVTGALIVCLLSVGYYWLNTVLSRHNLKSNQSS